MQNELSLRLLLSSSSFSSDTHKHTHTQTHPHRQINTEINTPTHKHKHTYTDKPTERQISASVGHLWIGGSVLVALDQSLCVDGNGFGCLGVGVGGKD